MKHYIYAIGAILCWASLPAATGSGLQTLTTEELMFFSFVSAAVYLYAQDVLLTKSYSVYLPGLKASLFGVSGIFIYHYTYYMALSLVPLAEGAILATTWSFWIVFFSSLIVFRKLKIGIVATAAIGMFGAALVISSGKDLSFSLDYMKGYLLALACGLIWSSFSVGLGYIKVEREPMTIFTIYAAVLSTVLYLVTLPHPLPHAASLLSAVYLGCIPLGLSFFLWNRAVTGGNLVIIGFLSYLTPPLAVLLVALIHGQRVSAQVLWGMALIIAASIGGRLFLGRSEKQLKKVV
jgi:drug/metabolite transporter (DMT)-like permease